MSPTPALSKGSLILVTGTSGYIGSHVANEALLAGYKVRGTARTEEKAENTRAIFKSDPNYSTAIVPDSQHEGAFDEAMKGCDAVIHVASDTTFGPNPNKVVGPMIAGVQGILRTAQKTPSVKRFVLTSSSTAVLFPSHDKEIVKTANDWNQETVDQAYAPPPYTEERGFAVYGASKTEGERALWKFMKDEKPHFVANSILPNLNWGRILPNGSPGVTGVCVPSCYRGECPDFPAQYAIDVIDDARLHLIAAAFDTSLNGERIFAFSEPFNWTDVITIIKDLYPNAKSVAEAPKNEPRDLSKVPNELGAELLRKWYGQDGYKPMKKSIEENLEGIA